jgi:hypothetical protein
MRRGLILLLLIALLAPLAAAADVRAKLQAIPADTPLELHLKNNEKVRGLKGDAANDGFVLRVKAQGVDADRKIAYDEIKSFKRIDHQSHVGRNIGIGVGIAVAAVATVLIVALIEFKNHGI